LLITLSSQDGLSSLALAPGLFYVETFIYTIVDLSGGISDNGSAHALVPDFGGKPSCMLPTSVAVLSRIKAWTGSPIIGFRTVPDKLS